MNNHFLRFYTYRTYIYNLHDLANLANGKQNNQQHHQKVKRKWSDEQKEKMYQLQCKGLTAREIAVMFDTTPTKIYSSIKFYKETKSIDWTEKNNEKKIGTGSGKSKKEAEENAAQNALEKIDQLS